MLSFFRRFSKSRFGLIAVFLVLGVIALAFAASDVTGLRSAAVGGSGNVVATVGSPADPPTSSFRSASSGSSPTFATRASR
ncbi:MAG: hypothetical protein WDN44_10435 [Sphingomonas sp.]